MSLSVESVREASAELAAGLVHMRDWLASLAEERAAYVLTTFRSEVRRAVLAIALALTSAFFACAAGMLAVFSLLAALWEGHRVLAGLIATACCALIAVAAVLGLRSATRPVLRDRGFR